MNDAQKQEQRPFLSTESKPTARPASAHLPGIHWTPQHWHQANKRRSCSRLFNGPIPNEGQRLTTMMSGSHANESERLSAMNR